MGLFCSGLVTNGAPRTTLKRAQATSAGRRYINDWGLANPRSGYLTSSKQSNPATGY